MTSTSPTERFLEKLSQSLGNGSFVRLTLSHPVEPPDAPHKVHARWVELKGVPHLSLTAHHATQDVTQNLPLAEAIAWIRERLAGEFRSALLGTTRKDWQWHATPDAPARLVAHKPSVTTAPSRTHDQPRRALLDNTAQDWLQGLGVADSSGRVFARMADKHRQINRYLEILAHLLQDAAWPADQPITLADMGCGKGYLTFGAWHLLRRVQGRRAQVLGVEARPKLVTCIRDLARHIGAEGLEFVAGTIETASLPPVDALIALHACDTATDHAMVRGVRLGARLIVVAPCCHREVRPQLRVPKELAPVARHGVMTERLAEWATDGLRALCLEAAGYRTKLFEFVASEHTPKNLMLAAVRARRAPDAAAARERIAQFKSFFGLDRHTLDALWEPPASAPPVQEALGPASAEKSLCG
jgi:SAM-dependent methyltransferase